MKILVTVENEATPGAVFVREETEIAERPDGGYNGSAIAQAVSRILNRLAFAAGDAVNIRIVDADKELAELDAQADALNMKRLHRG